MANKKYNQGSLLVEAVVTTSLFLVAALAVLGASATITKASLGNIDKVKATYLEIEGLEAVRIMRDTDWDSNFPHQSPGTPFYLEFNGLTWVSTTSPALIGGSFQRQITITNVSRDGNQNIVTSGGASDVNTKKVSVGLSWSNGSATSTKSISTYFTNVFDN